jgi:hypothetical protein
MAAHRHHALISVLKHLVPKAVTLPHDLHLLNVIWRVALRIFIISAVASFQIECRVFLSQLC